MVKHQAAALECAASIDWLDDHSPPYPPTLNDPEAFKFAMGVGTKCAHPFCLPQPCVPCLLCFVTSDLVYHQVGMMNDVRDVCRLLGDDNVYSDYEPTMGGEDFAFYGLSGIPSTFMFLGSRNEKIGAVHSLHSPRFKLDESVLPTGAALHAALAFEYLNNRDGAQKAVADEL